MNKTAVEEHAERDSGSIRQLVALQLGSEIYGVDIAAIHTVLMPQAVTTVPQTPDYFKGVMNLRGQILPVIDLRIRFGLPAETHPKMRIVIVNVEGVTAGMIVDAVSEVLRLPQSAIDPPSVLLSSAAADCITGIGRSEATQGDMTVERLILLLDVAKLIGSTLAETDGLLRDIAA